MTNEKLKKLPKYAQEHIRYLENLVRKLEDECNTVVYDKNNNSKMVLVNRNEDKPLPNGSRIRFRMDNITEVEEYVEIMEGDKNHKNEVLIYGSRGINIIPRANNHIIIKLGN